MLADNYRRNHLAYQAAGVSVNDWGGSRGEDDDDREGFGNWLNRMLSF